MYGVMEGYCILKSYCKQINAKVLLLSFLQYLNALKIFPYWYKATKPLNHLYIVDPQPITLTVLLGNINQSGRVTWRSLSWV